MLVKRTNLFYSFIIQLKPDLPWLELAAEGELGDFRPSVDTLGGFPGTGIPEIPVVVGVVLEVPSPVA